MRHLVYFSGGLGSWAAALRVRESHPGEDMTLLFADTLMEDEDLYRFLGEAADDIGVPVTRIADGRTPWELFRDRRFLGNSRVDPCSETLKRNCMAAYRDKHFTPTDTITYFGIDWTEINRLESRDGKRGVRHHPNHKGWRVEAPLCEPPYLSRQDLLALAVTRGIKPPRLYELGFSHNNCGGFCVKAGHGHFALLLEKMPERYAYHENKELRLRRQLGDISILRDRRNGTTKPLTLRELRLRIEQKEKVDRSDIGGCGCAL